jgi:hypothetical protein
MSDSIEKVKKLLHSGSDIAGASTGGAIGFLLGGPGGAAIGGGLGVVATNLLKDIANRSLSQREETRVGAAASQAIYAIGFGIQHGRTLRNDHFFDKQVSGVSPAEEIFEGILQKAKNDHEDQKNRFYGKLFANIAFESDCSTEEANRLLRIMDSFTFTQLVLLNIANDPTKFHLQSIAFQGGTPVTYRLISLLSEYFDLFQRGYLRLQKPNDVHGEIVLEKIQIIPAFTYLTDVGKRFFDLASLDEIDNKFIQPIVVDALTP